MLNHFGFRSISQQISDDYKVDVQKMHQESGPIIAPNYEYQIIYIFKYLKYKKYITIIPCQYDNGITYQ